MCQFRYESVRAWQKQPKGQWKPKQERKEGASKKKPSTSSEVGTSQVQVPMVCVNELTALHSPIWINGVKFMRCLIDYGS